MFYFTGLFKVIEVYEAMEFFKEYQQVFICLITQKILISFTSGLALPTFAPFLVRSMVCFGPTFACWAPTGDPELKIWGLDLVLVMTEVCFAMDIEFWVELVKLIGSLPPKLVKLVCLVCGWSVAGLIFCSALELGFAIVIEF